MAEERADASEAGEPVDLGAVGVREGDAFDLTIELVTPTDFVVHERQILAEDGTVLWREALLVEQPLEPRSMLGTPASSVAEDETAASPSSASWNQ